MIKNEKKISILYVIRLESTISMLTAIRSIQRAKRDSDGYRIRKYITLKSILFIMFANLKIVLRRYTSLYGIFMSASLTLYSYKNMKNMTNSSGCLQQRPGSDCTTAQSDVRLNQASTRCRATIGPPAKRHLIVTHLKNLC